jgi:hypothetical protein
MLTMYVERDMALCRGNFLALNAIDTAVIVAYTLNPHAQALLIRKQCLALRRGTRDEVCVAGGVSGIAGERDGER